MHTEHAIIIVSLDDFAWWSSKSYAAESRTTPTAHGSSSQHTCIL
jgi:hypothetical protein